MVNAKTQYLQSAPDVVVTHAEAMHTGCDDAAMVEVVDAVAYVWDEGASLEPLCCDPSKPLTALPMKFC